MTNYNHLKDWEDKHDEEVEARQPQVTKRGVYKDLDASPYEMHTNNKTLKFSSEAKKQKFLVAMKTKELQLERAFVRTHGENFDREKTNFNGLIDSMILFHYNKLKLK